MSFHTSRYLFLFGRALAGFICLLYSIESANTKPTYIRWLFFSYWIAMCVSYVIAPAKIFKSTALRIVVIGNHVLLAMLLVIANSAAYRPNQTLSIGHLKFSTEISNVIITVIFMASGMGAVSSIAEYVLCKRSMDKVIEPLAE